MTVTAYIHQCDPEWEMGVSSKVDAYPCNDALDAYNWLQRALADRWPDNYQWVRVGARPVAIMPLSHQKLAWWEESEPF